MGLRCLEWHLSFFASVARPVSATLGYSWGDDDGNNDDYVYWHPHLRRGGDKKSAIACLI